MDSRPSFGLFGSPSSMSVVFYGLFPAVFYCLQRFSSDCVDVRTFLEKRIKQLMKEKDENAQKEVASEREKTKLLYDEKNRSMQNEVSLKEKLIKLGFGKGNGWFKPQRVASLEAKILQLEGEKGSWVQKEVDFEDKTNQLVDEPFRI
ncbi:hypothetical protein CASFOL_040108 [Castilleja foliolosa]|uniref:Uncharacterized protein n=1 Tax=Castilleja foliolosa TaxID=1961234 RepID=A0ABD3BF43_9LAMI